MPRPIPALQTRKPAGWAGLPTSPGKARNVSCHHSKDDDDVRVVPRSRLVGKPGVVAIPNANDAHDCPSRT
jgi:hypothetical protein